MYTYCLFCNESKCEDLVKALQKRLDCRAVYPKKNQLIFKQQQHVTIQKPIFPGYIFLYRETPIDFQKFYMDGVTSILNAAEKEPSLKGNDHDFAMMILKKNGLIGKIKVIEKDSRLYITENEFENVDVTIQKIDRRKHLMLMVLIFDGSPIKIWAEYEIVDQEV